MRNLSHSRFMCLCLLSLLQTIPAHAQENVVSPTLTHDAKVNHSFVFKADKQLTSVSLVGSFNNWNKTTNPMKVDADGVTWRLTLSLDLGRYVYKFVLFTPEEKWIVDPNAPLDETDKINDNSVLMVYPADYDVPASPNDGKTAAGALFHSNSTRDVSYDEGQITLSLRARPDDLKQIWLQSASKKYPLKLIRSDALYAYYSATMPWNRRNDLIYDFELVDGDRNQKFGANGLNSHSQPFKIGAKTFQPYLLTDAPEPLKMNGPLTTQRVAGPAWAKNQPIYEVNLDKYGFPKGTALREFEKHLPVLKEMGVGLIWFMPLHPRGEKKSFGSPYAVRDYTEINPDFGTKGDFRRLVKRAHELGLHVVIDWVANHTSWDNKFIETHPEFYAKDTKSEISQAADWFDVAQLDYGKAGNWNQPLWNQMRDDMAYWLREFDIDGFRADVAGRGGKVPVEFWNWLRPQLDTVKPVFMLAEADDAYLHPAFDMTYSWALPPVLWDVTAGNKPATAIDDTLRNEARTYPTGAIQMRFLDNHDWHDHADWGWGDKPAIDTKDGLPQVAPLMVLCTTLPGKPLIYNGQEMSFLKTDPAADAAARTKSPVWPFYSRLMELYKQNPAIVEGSFVKLASNRDDKTYSFIRQRGNQRVLVVANLSAQTQNITLNGAALGGEYLDWFGNKKVTLKGSPSLNLAPWGYHVYVSQIAK